LNAEAFVPIFNDEMKAKTSEDSFIIVCQNVHNKNQTAFVLNFKSPIMPP